MKLELRNVSRIEKLSEETPCYTASLYVDHLKVADLSNTGHGGPDDVKWIKPEKREEIEAYVAAMPPIDCGPLGMPGETLPMDLEVWCHEQVDEITVRKELKRLLARRLVVTNQGMILEVGKPEQLRAPGGKAFRDALVAKYNQPVLLNDLDFEVALAIYRNPKLTPDEVVLPVEQPSPPGKPVEGFDEATPEELAAQKTRPRRDEYDEQMDDAKSELEPPVEGESTDERKERIRRNDERLAEVNPRLKDELRGVAEEVARRHNEHPGSRLKNPPDVRPKEPKRKEIAAGSLRDRLLRAGIKEVQHRVRQHVAKLICETEGGVSTATLSEITKATAHDIGNHIYYLRWENGYKIDHRMDGKVKKYFGRPPSADELAAASGEANKEDAA